MATSPLGRVHCWAPCPESCSSTFKTCPNDSSVAAAAAAQEVQQGRFLDSHLAGGFLFAISGEHMCRAHRRCIPHVSKT